MMLNWILSSSVLILGIIGIRFLFQKKMKCKLQYALWLLVLIRLPGGGFGAEAGPGLGWRT